jgi:hypothetical protein
MPAQTLVEAAQFLQLEPLRHDSRLYQDLGSARATKELTKLDLHLRNAAQARGAFVKAAFVGNRGSGKSSYLLHLAHELERQVLFTPLHIFLDPSLESDCDYSDLLLWMVDEVAHSFEKRGHPVDDSELSKVTVWFAETTIEKTTDWKKEIGLEASAETKGGYGIPGIFSLKLLARLKSMIVGSETTRKQIRQGLQNYANELRDRINTFFDHARTILKKAGKPDRLLIVQDNLDRLKRDTARQLFENGGDILIALRADLVYTAPIALSLAPYDIRHVFGHVFTMPNVKVRLRNGKAHKPGIDGLLALIGRRLELALVFESEKVARFLAEKSGGSVRDLIRLLDDAQLEAQVDGKVRVDMAAARAALKKLSVNFIRFLKPSSVYFPILAEIHRTKQEFSITPGEITKARIAEAREFFGEMIGNGTVLEYNGDDSWYGIHPAVCETSQFKDACKPAGSGQR